MNIPKKIANKILFNRFSKQIADVIFSPFTLLSCLLLKYLRKNWTYLPISERIYAMTGIFPIQDHYYEPLYNVSKHLKESLRMDRPLPGVDLNINEQLKLLEALNFTSELKDVPASKTQDSRFYFKNGFFSFGDAEFYYNLIRHYKPKRIFEIGSGNSTLIALMAANRNKLESQPLTSEIVCIEPYEMPWLEQIGVTVLRKRVQDIDVSFFKQLERNDVLFIDSSHMIRPQGDVLFEILQILPSLNSGVIIHIHDIFTPKDYIDDWVKRDHRFWNEQYLLEAFLTCNNSFKVLASLNYLRHSHEELFAKQMIVTGNAEGTDPASFWIVKN